MSETNQATSETRQAMSNNNKHAVELQDVTRIYQQGKIQVHALRGLTLNIEKGEFTAVCGPSG